MSVAITIARPYRITRKPCPKGDDDDWADEFCPIINKIYNLEVKQMIKHGPVDVVVLAAGEPRFDGSIFAELERQASSGTIKVLDAMILL
jgi:hypothetical protein